MYRATPKDVNDDDNNHFLPPNNQCKLTPEETEVCEGELKEKECLETLKSMQNEKALGSDGFPVEFYSVFWKVACEKQTVYMILEDEPSAFRRLFGKISSRFILMLSTIHSKQRRFLLHREEGQSN